MAFIPELAFSVVDIAEIIGRKEILKKWLGYVIDLENKPPPSMKDKSASETEQPSNSN